MKFNRLVDPVTINNPTKYY